MIATAAFGMDIDCPDIKSCTGDYQAPWRSISRKVVEQDKVESSLWQYSMMAKEEVKVILMLELFKKKKLN